MNKQISSMREFSSKRAVTQFYKAQAAIKKRVDSPRSGKLPQCFVARLLDPAPYLCDTSFCYGADAGVPRYCDDNHLNETGNRRLVPLFATVFSTKQTAPAVYAKYLELNRTLTHALQALTGIRKILFPH